MIATERAQSLSEFHDTAVETLDRLKQTGEPEILTVDGEARAVLLSPDVYEDLAREALLNRDVEAIRLSMRQFEEGKCRKASEFFDELHAKLLAMEADQAKGVAK